MTHAFPACVQCTLRTDDNSVMQSGGECVRAYVSVSLEQVAQWQDGQGILIRKKTDNDNKGRIRHHKSNIKSCFGKMFVGWIDQCRCSVGRPIYYESLVPNKLS